MSISMIDTTIQSCSPGTGLYASFRRFVQQMDSVVAELRLGRAQLDLLMQIALDPGILQHVCAERMGVTKSNITQHVDQLEKKGGWFREKEGRISRLYLTDAGREMMADIMPVHDARVKEIFSVIINEEFQQFQSVLRKPDRSSK